ARPKADGTALVSGNPLLVHGAIALARQEEDVDRRRVGAAPERPLHPTAQELLGRIAAIVERALLVQHWSSVEGHGVESGEATFEVRHVESQPKVAGIPRGDEAVAAG